MVFQSFNLWSHMTILENVIEGPVHVLGRSRKACLEEAEQLLEKVGITASDTPIQPICPAVSNNGLQLRGHWP